MRAPLVLVVLFAVAVPGGLASCGGSQEGTDPDAPPGTPDAPPTTCDVCHHGDGCCPAGCERATDSDCPAALLPRLVVADATGGIGIWNNAGTLTDRAPDAVLDGIDGAAQGLAVHENRLVVISDGAEFPVAIYDDAWNAQTSATVDTRVSAADVGASRLELRDAHVDAAGNLWMLEGIGRVLLVKGGALGTPTGAAQFTHPWDQLASMAVAGDKLFAGQISGAGIVVWNDPLSRSGLQTDADWQLADVAAWALTAGGDRLYALDSGPQTHLVAWDGVTALAAPRAADIDLEISTTQAVGDLAWHDNALVAVVANGVTENRVAIYADSAGVGAGSTPDDVVAPDTADYLQKSYLDQAGNLYVLDVDGIYVYRDALGTPALVTKLTTFSQPVDFVVIE